MIRTRSIGKLTTRLGQMGGGGWLLVSRTKRFIERVSLDWTRPESALTAIDKGATSDFLPEVERMFTVILAKPGQEAQVDYGTAKDEPIHESSHFDRHAAS
jgi:hypothetical protein